MPDDLKVVSYFPARAGWTLMWSRFDPAVIDRDLARIASLGANTVRIVVSPSVFGYPDPSPRAMGRLDRVVSLASRRKLAVQLTLFDWWHAYADVDGSRRWADGVLGRYRGDRRIAVVELKNELDPRDQLASEWARELIPHVRRASAAPVAISAPALDTASDLGRLRDALGDSQPDLYAAHFYLRPEFAYHDLRQAKEAVAPVPLFVGETGYSTALSYGVVSGVPRTASAREAMQAYYLRSVALAARRIGLPAISPWILYDFDRGAIPRDDPGVYGNPREYRFGLFTTVGDPKPAAAAVRRLFSGRYSYRFNNGFERGVSDDEGLPVPELWRIRQARHATFALDTEVAHRGRASARISSVGGRTGPEAAFFISPPDASVSAGDRSTVVAHARASGGCGAVSVSIGWYGRDGWRLHSERSRPLVCATGDWQRLRVSGVAPAGAVYVRVHLRAARADGSVWFDDVGYTARRGHVQPRRSS